MNPANRSEQRMIFLKLLALIMSLLYSMANGRNEQCHLGEKTIRKMYSKYLKLSRSVSVRVLRTENSHNDEIDLFANRLVRNIQVPTTVIEENITDQGTDQKAYQSKVELVRISSKNKDSLKAPSSFNLHFVIAWDYELFYHYLDRAPELPTKASLIVILLCPALQMEPLAQILVYLWTQYRILNSFGNAPCSCQPDDTYSYRPFERIGNQWGLITISKSASPVWDKMNDLQGIPFKVSVFERFPSLVFTLEGMQGLDHNVLVTLAERMNFTLEIDDEKDFGIVSKDGSASGSLGKVVRGEVDMAGNSRFVADPETSHHQYTIPITTEDLCIIVPKSEGKPRWMAIFGIFQWQVWLYILGIELVCVLFWCIRKKLTEDTMDYIKAWLEVYSISFLVPVKITAKNRSIFFSFACLSLNVVIAGIFQGNYVKSFSIVQYHTDIDTLEQFLQSDYLISTGISNVFDGIESETFKKLKQRIVDSLMGVTSVYMTAHFRNISSLARKEEVPMMLKVSDTLGYPMIHMVRECPRTFLVAYVLQKNCPFIYSVNRILRRLIEGGLIEKWRNIDNELHIFRKMDDNHNNFRRIDIDSVRVAFYILMGGNALALVVIVLELYWCRILLRLGIAPLLP
ncbi:hypothetical protein JTB14_005470 [Gonioctena quinquepunctata]|nr:hypothetical protein JTB14_005470 [Gonioctena quinquepunctata]